VIKVVDYNPAWPGLFEAEKKRMMALIADMVDAIHHVGSTAVVGLCAKPKIDIDAVLCSDAMVAHAVERLKLVDSFTFHGDPYNDGMWTFTSGHGSYGTRLYVCGPENPTHCKRLLFRDWLRSHPDDAAEYAALKRRLANEANGEWEFYTGGKAEFVARIVRQALISWGRLGSAVPILFSLSRLSRSHGPERNASPGAVGPGSRLAPSLC